MRRRKRQKDLAWRPDFRDTKSLPDNKVVRTHFLFNFLALVLVLGLGVFLFLNEKSISLVKDDLAMVRESVELGTPSHKKNISLSGSFVKESKKFEELERFLKAPFYMDELLFALSEAQPPESKFSSIGYNPAVPGKKKGHANVFYRISINGNVTSSKEKTGREVLLDFYENLKVLPLWKDLLRRSDINYFRNDDSGLFGYVLTFDVNLEKKGK